MCESDILPLIVLFTLVGGFVTVGQHENFRALFYINLLQTFFVPISIFFYVVEI